MTKDFETNIACVHVYASGKNEEDEVFFIKTQRYGMRRQALAYDF